MTLTIRPGYDFDVYETPNMETLLRQATGMQISGVGIDALDSSVVGLKSGDVSNVTESLQVGDTTGGMWMSPLGDLWVQEQSGPVILNRIHGGWETRRQIVEVDASFPNHKRPGSLVKMHTNYGPFEDTLRQEQDSSRVSGTPNFACADSGSYDETQNGFHFGVLAGETATSNFERVVWRGLTVYSDRDETLAQTHSQLRDMQNGYRIKAPRDSDSSPMMQADYWHTNLTSYKSFGWVGAPAVSASKVSDAGGDHTWRVSFMTWCFGSQMYTNKDN